MYLLGLAFIAWIACGGLVVGYFVELQDRVSILNEFTIVQMEYANRSIDNLHRRVDEVETVAKTAQGRAIAADIAAKAAQKAIDDHEQWVANERRKNAEVIQRARKAARGHNG